MLNNLYTIVPLRTAASKILREQMVGRGLRLPYGERTGDKDVDAVMLTAHDKFQDILAEAQKGDSIFKAGNVIQAEEELDEPEEIVYTQLSLDIDQNETLEQAYVQTGLPTSEENEHSAANGKSLFASGNDKLHCTKRESTFCPCSPGKEENCTDSDAEAGRKSGLGKDL